MKFFLICFLILNSIYLFPNDKLNFNKTKILELDQVLVYTGNVFHKNDRSTSKKIKKVQGYAIVCSAAKNKKFHMTLAYVKTNDLIVVKKIEQIILKYIKNNYLMNNHH